FSRRKVQEQRIGGAIPSSGLEAGAAFEDLKSQSQISNHSMARWPDNPILFASSTWHLTPDTQLLLSPLRKYGIILFSEVEEKTLACPICNKRKVKRLCPARAESICSICCGTEREVTIDCPSNCVHLVASRQYDMTRLQVDWEKVPFPESKFNRSFAETHGSLILAIDHAICQF